MSRHDLEAVICGELEIEVIEIYDAFAQMLKIFKDQICPFQIDRVPL